MCSRTRNDAAEWITEDMEIDCPEYIIFRLNNGGSWDMGKVAELYKAQEIIAKPSTCSKQNVSRALWFNTIR